MNFKRVLCLIMAFIISASCYLVPVRADELEMPEASAAHGSHGLDATACLLGNGRLVDNTKAALLYETKTQTLLYSYNADERMYPSSFVKMMTLLIALEEGDLEQVVTVKQETLNSIPNDAMVVYLSAGEMLTLHDLLYCMMVGSGNDAAAVIAETVAGTQTAFVEKMNDYAKQIGCTDTNFVNVHGLHHADQYTTARDSAKIFAEGLKNDKFREIVCAQSYEISESENTNGHKLVTNNYLISSQVMEIYRDSRVLGGRTGTTNNKERCVASVARSGNMEIVCITMGSKSVYEPDGYTIRVEGGFPETKALLNYSFQGFNSVALYHKDQVMRQYSVMGGNCDLFLGAVSEGYTVLPAGVTVNDLSFVYHDTFAGAYPNFPIKKGSVLSHLEVWYENICVGSVELYAMNAVTDEEPIYIPSIQSGGQMQWWTWILIAVGILAALFIALLLALRYIPAFRKLLFGRRKKKFKW